MTHGGGDRLSVLLCTEGTYPYVGGGVSTWCDMLCSGLDEVDFTIYAVTAAPEVRLRYELPPNASRIVHVPLWGAVEPPDYILADLPPAEVRARRAATTPAAIEAAFVPLLVRLLEEMRGDRADVEAGGGPAVWLMWRFFQRHDWRTTWKSPLTWRAFVAEMGLAAAERDDDEQPTVDDLTNALQLLYNLLLPLSAPLPPADLVHTTIAGFPGLAGVVASCEHGTPLLVTEHGVWVRERYISVSTAALSGFLKRFLMDLSTHVARLNYLCAAVVSPVTGYNVRWELHYDVAAEKVQAIPNGVDPAVFVPRPKPEETRGRPTVVAAARIFALKDVETMIRSAAVARESLPEIRYRVYGALDADPPYVERCRALIAELGLEETFALAGHHSNPAGLFAEGDISVLSSISEGFPFTVLESMACARPVIATDVGGVREALEGFGIVVPPRDHVALGEAAVRLLRDDDLRAHLGRQAREHVLARYRTAHMVDAYRELYRRLADRRRPAIADREPVLA